MDVAAIHGGFLQGARAAARVLRLDAEVATLERQDGAWKIGLARRREVVAAQHHQRRGRVGRCRGRAGRRHAGRPGAEAAHRLHLRRALRTSISRTAADGRSTSTRPGTSSPRSASSWARRPMRRPRRPATPSPEEIDIAIAVERIETATTLQASAASRTSGRGLRSFVADKNLVVGYDPQVEGFFWLAGQGGYGIQTGESAGRLAASLALGNGMPGDIAGLWRRARQRFRPPASRSGDRKFTLHRQALTSR